MLEIIKNNYLSYRNSRKESSERHFLRVALVALIAVLAAFSVTAPTSDVTTLMVTGLTILTGFTFTALFSDHASAEAGLPKPMNETDRVDVERLAALSKNFRVRSTYFITFSIINVLILISIGMGFDIYSVVLSFMLFLKLDPSNLSPVFVNYYRLVSWILFKALLSLSIFLFIENLYTFYRLSQTTLSIINT